MLQERDQVLVLVLAGSVLLCPSLHHHHYSILNIGGQVVQLTVANRNADADVVADIGPPCCNGPVRDRGRTRAAPGKPPFKDLVDVHPSHGFGAYTGPSGPSGLPERGRTSM